MPQNRWPPRAHVVHVFVPVHIPDVRPFSFIDKKRLAAHRTKSAHRRVYTSRNELEGFGKELFGFGPQNHANKLT